MHKGLSRAAAAAFAALAFGLAIGAAAAAPVYRITIVPPLDPAASGCDAIDLNDRGQVLATCVVDGRRRDFVWSAASGTTEIRHRVGVIGSVAINNAGHVAGELVFGDGGFPKDAFWWRPGVLRRTRLALGVGHVMDIDDHDRVLGDGFGVPEGRPFVWTPGTGFVDPAPAAVYPLVFAINASGQVAGTVPAADAFVAEPDGAVTRLGTGACGPSEYLVQPLAIDNRGRTAGNCARLRPWPTSHAIFWPTPDAPVDLHPSDLPGSSFALSLNEAGQVVGRRVPRSIDDFAETAFYWDAATGMVDLPALIDPADPLRAATLLATNPRVNRGGAIAISGRIDGDARALLLQPVR